MTYTLRGRMIPYLLLAPAAVIMVLVIFYPMVYSAQISFTDAQLLRFSQREYIGLENYTRMLNRSDFWTSVGRTLTYTAGTVVISYTVGLFVAVILNQNFRMRWLVRTLMMIPWATPWLVVTLIWFVMFNPQIGPINQVLKGLGIIESGRTWLYSSDTAMLSIVITTSWRLFPAVTLILLASLQSIPSEPVRSRRGRWGQPPAAFLAHHAAVDLHRQHHDDHAADDLVVQAVHNRVDADAGRPRRCDTRAVGLHLPRGVHQQSSGARVILGDALVRVELGAGRDVLRPSTP